MKIEPETLKRLRNLLDDHSDWGQRIEQFVADYGQLKPDQVPSLSENKLRGLWWAQGFAKCQGRAFECKREAVARASHYDRFVSGSPKIAG